LLDSPDFISHHHFANTKTHENQLKSLYFTIIELPKFNKELYECTSMVDKWCYFFKMAEKSEVKDIDSLSCGDKSIKMAYEELEEMKWNKADLMRYEEAHFRDDKYKRSIEEAVKEAVEETKKQQKLEMELKMEESKKQQKLEIEENKKQQKLEIAKTLLDSGLKLNFASKSTGLTPQEIKDYLEKANGSTKD
jgi:predicted transposase/invertase (TIGR01784 family)